MATLMSPLDSVFLVMESREHPMHRHWTGGDRGNGHGDRSVRPSAAASARRSVEGDRLKAGKHGQRPTGIPHINRNARQVVTGSNPVSPTWETCTYAGRIRSLSFDEDGSILAAECGDGTARLWNGHGELLAVVPAAGGWSRTVALDSAGSHLAVGAGTDRPVAVSRSSARAV